MRVLMARDMLSRKESKNGRERKDSYMRRILIVGPFDDARGEQSDPWTVGGKKFSLEGSKARTGDVFKLTGATGDGQSDDD